MKLGRILRLGVLITLFCAAAFTLVTQVSSALVEATERDVTFRYFDEALPDAPVSANLVEWLASPSPLDRAFGPAEQELVGTALTRAWAAHAVAMEINLPLGLSDHFTGVALERASSSVGVPGMRMVVLNQTARPVFFHADGSLLQVETEAMVARYRLSENGDLIGFAVTRDTNLTTLLNESAGWRIISHERRAASAVLPDGDSRPIPALLAGINYYPSNTPWTAFWSEFDTGIIAQDFDLIEELGANAIRIFLHRDTFLHPVTAQTALDDLATLLELAERHDLAVIPTLFDLRSGYGAVGWAHDAEWLSRVLPVLSASSAVAYVDLKNEADLDMQDGSAGQVEAWSRAMLTLARGIAPTLPYTIGWSSPEAAGTLADTLDLISYHDYGDADQSAGALAQVRQVAGGRPVHVTEIGETSYSLFAGIFPASPDLQASRLSDRLEALSDADGIFIWTLHDFEDPDSDAIGLSPWVNRLQSRFGLFSADGSRKPAALTVQAAFETLLSSQQ